MLYASVSSILVSCSSGLRWIIDFFGQIDKTGTLTEDGLDVFGVRIIDRISRRYNALWLASDCTDSK